MNTLDQPKMIRRRSQSHDKRLTNNNNNLEVNAHTSPALYKSQYSSLSALPKAIAKPCQILPKSEWIPDEKRSHCVGCKRKFILFLVRRHHCRVCGEIFCHYCSYKYLSTIKSRRHTVSSSYDESQITTENTTKVRVCLSCYNDHLVLPDIDDFFVSLRRKSQIIKQSATSPNIEMKK